MQGYPLIKGKEPIPMSKYLILFVFITAIFAFIDGIIAAAAAGAEKFITIYEGARFFGNRLDALVEPLRGEGLAQKLVHAGVPRCRNALAGTERGHENDGCIGIIRVLPETLGEFDAVHVAEIPVDDDKVGLAPLEDPDAARAVRAGKEVLETKRNK